MLHEANLRYIVFTKCQNLCSFGRHVVKPGTEEQKTPENGMPEHLIRNGKTRKTKSGTPTYRTILLGGIAKPGIVKHGTPNLEMNIQTMWTAPLR